MSAPLTVLDLFSGIGGFSLGLERTGGFRTVAFCEIEEFPRRVLAKHWPDVPIHRDVRELKAEHVGAVDVICGGFPCQDISTAGKGAGLAGERSGLWREYARLVGELRPSYVIVENVAALLGRGLGTVLGDLAALGYDAEWHCIPASAVGAPHIRDRVWIIAYPQHSDADRAGPHRAAQHVEGNAEPADQQVRFVKSLGALLAHPEVVAQREQADEADAITTCRQARNELSDGGPVLADSGSGRQPGSGQPLDALNPKTFVAREATQSWHGRVSGEWRVEPNVGRVAHGVPHGVERLTALGNAVVPQIPELLGRAILAAEAERVAA